MSQIWWKQRRFQLPYITMISIIKNFIIFVTDDMQTAPANNSIEIGAKRGMNMYYLEQVFGNKYSSNDPEIIYFFTGLLLITASSQRSPQLVLVHCLLLCKGTRTIAKKLLLCLRKHKPCELIARRPAISSTHSFVFDSQRFSSLHLGCFTGLCERVGGWRGQVFTSCSNSTEAVGCCSVVSSIRLGCTVHFSTLKMLLLLCLLWSTSHAPVVFAAPVLPGDGNPALDMHLGATVPAWYTAMLAVVCIVCPVLLLTMCICCKKSAFKEVNSISSHVSRDMQLQGMSSGNQSPLQEQIQFESLPDLSHVWKPSHFPSTATVRFPQTFEEESPEDTAAAVHWFGSPHQNFPRSQLQYVRQIGTGRYGLVLEGRALGVFSDHTSTPESCASSPRTPPSPPSQVVSVVVKTLREEANQQQQAAFLQEMAPYRVLDHRNVLRVLAVCLESPPLLVLLQYCNKGTLKRHLQQEGATLTQRQLLTIITDVAAGLAHMHEHNFCHTDLAARNCLVDGDGTVKVGDYGCSLDRYKHEYYLAGDIALPLRWCPPESLTCTPTVIHTSRVNTWGNVWSYGVVCHEVFTQAAHLPYHPLNDEQVLQRVVVDQALTPDLPPSLHIQVRALIQQCWVPESSRISMTVVHSGLCQTLLQLYGVQHPSYDPDSLPSSLHLPVSPRSVQEDLDAKWNKLEQEQRRTKDHSVSVTSPRDQLRFENDFVSREEDDLEARVAATFGSSAPSWLGLDPDQPMDSLSREISSAIQRLDDALAQPPNSDLKDPVLDDQNKNFKDDDLLPAFVIGKDSLVTRAPRSLANMSASTSNLTSIGVDPTSTTAAEPPSSENITKFAHLSSSAGFMTQMGLEEDGLSLRLEKGEFSELVKQKSMSVQNLMRLTVVDGINLDEDYGESDSSFKFSMGEKNINLFQISVESSAKKQSAEEKLPLDFSGSTSSILSSALSTSSGATRSSVRDPFLVAANSSELLLQEELSEQEFTLNEGGSNPNLTVEEIAVFSNSKAEGENDSCFYSTNSSVHQQGNRSPSGGIQSFSVSLAEELIGIEPKDSSGLKDSIFRDSREDLLRKLELETPCTNQNPKQIPSSGISSQDGPVLSTPDVTMEACHSLGCVSSAPFCSSSSCEDQHHHGSFDGGQDPLPDIVVHDHATHAKRHYDVTDEHLQSNKTVSNLSSENLPSEFDKTESRNSMSKSSVEHKDFDKADRSDQWESPLKTSLEQNVDVNSSDRQGLCSGRHDSPKFDPELNSTFSIFTSKDALGESRDSETSGIVTGGCTVFTEDITNCSGMSASEMLSSDSVFLDGTFDVAEDEENLHDCISGNTVSQDPELSEATVEFPETSTYIEQPNLTEHIPLNHESVSTVESHELITNFIVDPQQEVRVVHPDSDLLAVQALPVNTLDWSVDSLPPNSILDPLAGRHHFKLLPSDANKDVLPEEKELTNKETSLEQVTVAEEQLTDVDRSVVALSLDTEESKVQTEDLNFVIESTYDDITKIAAHGNVLSMKCVEESSKDHATLSPSEKILNDTVAKSDVILATNSDKIVIHSSVENNEVSDSYCVSESSPKHCNDGLLWKMKAREDVQPKNDSKVEPGLHSLTEELRENIPRNESGDHSTNEQKNTDNNDLQESFEENHTGVPALIDRKNGSNVSMKMTLTNQVSSSETPSIKVDGSDASPVRTSIVQGGKNGSIPTETGDVGQSDFVFNESDALTASTTSVNSDIAVIDTPEAENNEGEFWQQQMSAWKTAAQETRMLLLEASTASPLSRHQDESKKNGSYFNDDSEFSPCKSKDVDADSLSVTSSSAYSVNDRETDCSFESSPCRKKYPVTPAHFVALPRSGDSSSDSSPVCSTVRPLMTPAASEAKKVMGGFPSPIKRPSYLSSPTSSCGSGSPSGAHSSYVSYADDAFQDPLTEGEDLLGYCSEDLNALRAELSLKLPASPREKDIQPLSNDSEDEAQCHDGEESPDYTYCGNVSDDIEVVDNNRDHVIINYRPPTTLSPIKEEPCSSVGWDSCNFEENSASTYNSSIELVDCYEDSPSTSALDVVSVEDSVFNSFSLNKLSKTTLQGKQENEGQRVQLEAATENVDEVNSVPTECVSQHPISSSSVIFTANNEVIPVDRDSLILEDLETEEDRRSVLVFTPRDDPDKPKTLDSDDLLVVDVDTHEASIVETPKPRSLLAFVHSPPLSPQVLTRLKRDEEAPVTENEALEQLHEDYQDDVDQDSLPYEVNSSSDKLLYLKFRENLAEHNALNLKTRGAKDFRESGPRSIDCAFLSDPLCDMDFDSAWQQHSLDNFKLGEYHSTQSVLDSTEPSRDDMLRSDVNGCLTTNSPNTASETSQSSGLMFRLGTEEKETTGENVSRYQPYFNTSLNSLSQLDSSLLYNEDHVSLPYTVNLQSPDEQSDYVRKPSASFSNFKSLDSVVNSQNRMKDFVSSKAHSEDTFIRSEEIDLKDQMVRELGQQIECIKSYRKEKKTVNGDEDSSDEELTSFSLGLLTQAYNEGTNGHRHDSPEGSVQLSDDGSDSRKSFALEASVTVDERNRSSCANYDSDDYSAETDYTGSNERRVYDSLHSVAKPDDLIPRPMNPEPAELSDLPCTPSPSISIDCSVAPTGKADEGQKMHFTDNDVFTPVKSIVVNGYEVKDHADEKSDLDSVEKSSAAYRTFHATSLLKAGETESDDAVEDLGVGEFKSSIPSPIVTPGMLSSVRYRIDSNLSIDSSLPGKRIDVDGNDCIRSKFTSTDSGYENVGNSNDNYSSGVPVAIETRNNNDAQFAESVQISPDDEVHREDLYTPDFEEDDDDDEEKGPEASPGPSRRKTDDEVDSEDEDDEEPIESDDSDVSENNSSSSGEFLWQAGDPPAQARPAQPLEEEDEMSDGDSESGEEEFTPSFWDATRTPTRSLLKSGCEGLPHDRSVHWKRQRHHRVYEYPPEPPLPTFPPPPSHRPLWDPPITPFSPPHHQWGVDHPHGETYPALQAYMQRGFLQQDGFLLDDGEFYNPDLHYNFSQSSFAPSEFYSTDGQHGNPNTPNFDSPESSNMIGGVASSFLVSTAGDADPQLPPTHEQLQNMLLYQFAPTLTSSVKIPPKARQTSGDQGTSVLHTEGNALEKYSSEKLSSVAQDVMSCTSDVGRSELENLSSVGDTSSAVIDEAKNLNSVGELRHLKEQLKLNIPKLRNDDENYTGNSEGQSAMNENSSNSNLEVAVKLMCQNGNSGAAGLIESNLVSFDEEVPATVKTELISDIISSSNSSKLNCLAGKNDSVESKVGDVSFQTTASTSTATSPVLAIK
ncbi:Serine-threonine/tyrosine-protein kinase catalytic domain [Trinorchestia longiramus]|nr:Serine-threonine/tyrosine-protein kinase catalytic domain [Trinorchestia longiramus]